MYFSTFPKKFNTYFYGVQKCLENLTVQLYLTTYQNIILIFLKMPIKHKIYFKNLLKMQPKCQVNCSNCSVFLLEIKWTISDINLGIC